MTPNQLPPLFVLCTYIYMIGTDLYVQYYDFTYFNVHLQMKMFVFKTEYARVFYKKCRSISQWMFNGLHLLTVISDLSCDFVKVDSHQLKIRNDGSE